MNTLLIFLIILSGGVEQVKFPILKTIKSDNVKHELRLEYYYIEKKEEQE